MMKVFETIFDLAYLVLVVSMGIVILRKNKDSKESRLFGSMAILLGAGDAFHLFPRIYAMWTSGMAAHAPLLGFGQFVTSVTMTIFYVMLYHVWQLHYDSAKSQKMTRVVYLLALLRIFLCFMPQNQWFSPDAPLSWSIYRNLPFALLGFAIILLFYYKAKQTKDQQFRWMWLAVLLSFAFYVPVVLFAGIFPPVGALMIPKTCAYLWIVSMGFPRTSAPPLS